MRQRRPLLLLLAALFSVWINAMPANPYVPKTSTLEKKTRVEYNTVPLPSAEDLRSACALLNTLRESSESGPNLGRHHDVTNLIDHCIRFTCVAYRRNAAYGKRKTDVRCELITGGCEIQLTDHKGAHVVIYLLDAADGGILALLSFKGSTASALDWKANLKVLHKASRPLDEYDADRVETSRPAADKPCVHPGWLKYFSALEREMDTFRIGKLPSSCRKRWKLNTNDMTLWALLQSSKCDHVLCVGHSLGGALASIAATKLGERRERAIAADASAPVTPYPPSLVTFGCPVVGERNFVKLMSRVVNPAGGLRVTNKFDTIASVGAGIFTLTDASRRKAHAGLHIELINEPKYRLNPLLNHLIYVVRSEGPCCKGRAEYALPGVFYTPERSPAAVEGEGEEASADESTKPPPMPRRSLSGKLPFSLPAWRSMPKLRRSSTYDGGGGIVEVKRVEVDLS